MKVVFRADASIQIGTGHVMRCLTLAGELTRQGHECWFICREHLGHLGDLIVSKGHNLTLLPASTNTPPQQHRSASDDYARWLGVPWQEDANQTMDAISPLNADWLVVDHYVLDAQWESTLSSVADKIMVIDDLANRQHDCDILIDQNYGRIAKDYKDLVPGHCKILAGVKYAILKSEYRNRKPLIKSGEIKHCFLYFGGGFDSLEVLRIAIDAFNCDRLLNVNLHVVLPNIECDLNIKGNQDHLKRIIFHKNLPDLASLMINSDLSISAGGSTTWERCCVGIPSIVVSIAENQLPACVALESSGVIKYIGELPEFTIDKIRTFLFGLSKEELIILQANSQNLVDGHGVGRIINTMFE